MNIDKLCMSYIRQELLLAVALFLIALLVMRVWFIDTILTPAIISVSFMLVVAVSIALVWRRVAKGAPDSLPTFFTAVSGNKDTTMLPFFLVFMAFYFASLTHHSIFFASVSNRS